MTNSQELQALCEAICTQINPLTQKRYKMHEIATAVFGDPNAAVKFSQAKSESTPNQALNLFLGKTREDIISSIKTLFKTQLLAANYQSQAGSFFRFKQYFMNGEAADEQNVAVAELDLYYEKTPQNAFQYTKYTLYIAATDGFAAFRLQGSVQQFGTTSLVLVSEASETYHASTILHVAPSFFKAKPFDYVYYNGFYVTYTAADEQIAGPVILEMTATDAPINTEIPKEIWDILYKKRFDIQPPFPKK
jgi:hypothetical protein